jgi:hypothetical protein
MVRRKSANYVKDHLNVIQDSLPLLELLWETFVAETSSAMAVAE